MRRYKSLYLLTNKQKYTSYFKPSHLFYKIFYNDFEIEKIKNNKKLLNNTYLNINQCLKSCGN